MGAPVENSPRAAGPKIKKYVGNNLCLNLEGDKKNSFLIVGNNCCISLKNNESWIKIVGNNCQITVDSGGGSVIYVGNNGAIYLDHTIKQDVVTYEGNNGLVSSKNGSLQRHCSAGDVRNCDETIKVVNVDGKCFKVRTKMSRKITRLASTISLPNIQIHLNMGPSKNKSS